MKCFEVVEEYLLGFELIHDSRFDYSHDDFDCNLPIYQDLSESLNPEVIIRKNQKFKIWCPYCEKYFWSTIRKHLELGHGCPTCNPKYQNHHQYGSKWRASQTRLFRIRIKDIDNHFDEDSHPRYGYWRFFYVSSRDKGFIWCHACNLWFRQTPDKHKRGQGCPICAGKEVIDDNEFIARAYVIHCDDNNYRHVNYQGCMSKVIILCNKCDNRYEMTPSDHLSQKSSCPHCANIERGRRRRATTEEFIIKAYMLHGDTNNYKTTIYKGRDRKVSIECNICGKMYHIYPGHHLQGSSCPSCANRGFDGTESAIFYYLRMVTQSGKVVYKIGITNRTVKERYRDEGIGYQLLYFREFDMGYEARTYETLLKQLHSLYTYRGKKFMKNTGNTEVFVRDILLKDTIGE